MRASVRAWIRWPGLSMRFHHYLCELSGQAWAVVPQRYTLMENPCVVQCSQASELMGFERFAPLLATGRTQTTRTHPKYMR